MLHAAGGRWRWRRPGGGLRSFGGDRCLLRTTASDRHQRRQRSPAAAVAALDPAARTGQAIAANSSLKKRANVLSHP